MLYTRWTNFESLTSQLSRDLVARLIFSYVITKENAHLVSWNNVNTAKHYLQVIVQFGYQGVKRKVEKWQFLQDFDW